MKFKPASPTSEKAANAKDREFYFLVSRILHQPHKAEIHVQLHVTVIEREAGIVGDKIDLNALAARHVDGVFENPRRRLCATRVNSNVWR